MREMDVSGFEKQREREVGRAVHVSATGKMLVTPRFDRVPVFGHQRMKANPPYPVGGRAAQDALQLVGQARAPRKRDENRKRPLPSRERLSSQDRRKLMRRAPKCEPGMASNNGVVAVTCGVGPRGYRLRVR